MFKKNKYQTVFKSKFITKSYNSMWGSGSTTHNANLGWAKKPHAIVL